MDILFWTNLNRFVEIKDSQHLYFKKYLYRLTIHCPVGRAIYSADANMQNAIDLRTQYKRMINYGGSWGFSRSDKDLRFASAEQLEVMRSILVNKSTDIKVRVEEPYVSVYATNEDHLKDIILQFSTEHQQKLKEIVGPKNKEEEALLQADKKIIRRAGPINKKYKYQIRFKDRRVDNTVKHQLLGYLQGLGKDVHIPKSCKDMMSNDYGFWGVYIYTNDISIISFIELILPGCIGKVQELVVIDDK